MEVISLLDKLIGGCFGFALGVLIVNHVNEEVPEVPLESSATVVESPVATWESLTSLLIHLDEETPETRNLQLFPALVKACEKYTYHLFLRIPENTSEQVALWIKQKDTVVTHSINQCLVDSIKYGRSLNLNEETPNG